MPASRNFLHLSFVLLISLTSGQELQCGNHELQNAPLCIGDVIVSTCTIQSPVLLWIIETAQHGDFEIDFNARNSIGDTEVDGAFSANLTQHYPNPNTVSESVLQFNFSTELNGTTVVCPNLFNMSLSTSCVIRNSKASIPGQVNNIRTVQNSCNNSISWDEPDTGSIADHYMISVEPKINQCLNQGYITTETEMQLIGLENGVNYDISVSACNCFACGPATIVQNFVMNLTETALVEQLKINRPVYSVDIVKTEYAVILVWEQTLCVTSYSVKVTRKNSEDGNINSTLLNQFTHPALTRRSQLNVRVAGVNGKVTGPYSPELCIELEVPGNITNPIVNTTITSSGQYFLFIQWKSPKNISCTRPSVDYHIVNYDGQSVTAVDSNISINLPSTTRRTINVTIIPVNIIGMGNLTTVPVTLNGAITQTLSTMNLILVVIFALLTMI